MGGSWALVDATDPEREWDDDTHFWAYNYRGFHAMKGSILHATIEHLQALLDKPDPDIQTFIDAGIIVSPEADVSQAQKVVRDALGVAKTWVREQRGGPERDLKQMLGLLRTHPHLGDMLPEDALDMNYKSSITDSLSSAPASFHSAGIRGLYDMMKRPGNDPPKMFPDEAQRIAQVLTKALVFMDKPDLVKNGTKEMVEELKDFLERCTGNLYVE